MDRINAFLEKRKVKNKKTIKVKDKVYELTREDIKKVHRYLNNECLDENLELYQPMNTTFTKEVRETPIIKTKPDVKKERQFKRKIIRKKRVSKPKVEIWNDFEVEDMDLYYDTELYDGKIPLSDMTVPIENFNRILSKMIQKYFRSNFKKEKSVYKKIEINCNFPNCLAKKYDINNIILQKYDLILIKNEEKYEIFSLTLSNITRRLKILDYKSFCFYKDDLFYCLDDKIYKSLDLDDELIYTHSDKIEKFAIEGKNLAILSKNIITIINLETKNEIKLKKKVYLSLEFINNELFTLTNEHLRVYSLNDKKTNKFGSTVKSFSAGKYLVWADNEDLVLYHDKRKKYMNQNALIKETVSHKILPLFCCVLKNEIRIFFYKEGSAKLCTVLKGSFTNVFFHKEFPFLYGIRDGFLELYKF